MVLRESMMKEPLRPREAGKPRVLLIEDDADIRDLVQFHLEKEGMAVETAADGERGLLLAQSRVYDLVLLDLMLPVVDGLEICRRLRREERTAGLPVVIVTARGQEEDVVRGLNLGADDYVVKPFSMKELLARVRTALRRHRGIAGLGRTAIHRSGIELDPERHEVRVHGQPVTLTLTEFRLLHHLMKHPGRVFTRSDLLPHAVGPNVVVIDRNIDVHIRNLRRKLGEEGARHLGTVRGIGYKFES
jgi:DNA-binding response OmpR family regulator